MSQSEYKLPARVLLRCKQTAVVRQRGAEVAECFDFFGVTDEDNMPHLWRDDGKWREDGKPHPLDIVGVELDGHFAPFTG